MEDEKTLFIELKKTIYAMYVSMCKAHLANDEFDVEESDIDVWLARICMAWFNLEITYDEFKNLSSYLIQTYMMYKMKGV